MRFLELISAEDSLFERKIKILSAKLSNVDDMEREYQEFVNKIPSKRIMSTEKLLSNTHLVIIVTYLERRSIKKILS